jgi:hypothetical protein
MLRSSAVVVAFALGAMSCADTTQPLALPQPAKPPALSSLAKGEVGERVHLSGCENGTLTKPEIALWDSPAQAVVVAQLSGGRVQGGTECQGSVVILHGKVIRDEQVFYAIEAIDGDQLGWVEAEVLGQPFDPTTCLDFFHDAPDAATKCVPAGMHIAVITATRPDTDQNP